MIFLKSCRNGNKLHRRQFERRRVVAPHGPGFLFDNTIQYYDLRLMNKLELTDLDRPLSYAKSKLKFVSSHTRHALTMEDSDDGGVEILDC
jgi:hypothetical protein